MATDASTLKSLRLETDHETKHSQVVMLEVAENGWKKVGSEEEIGITDEEIRTLFNLIDKDKSGQLSTRVSSFVFYISKF